MLLEGDGQARLGRRCRVPPGARQPPAPGATYPCCAAAPGTPCARQPAAHGPPPSRCTVPPVHGSSHPRDARRVVCVCVRVPPRCTATPGHPVHDLSRHCARRPLPAPGTRQYSPPPLLPGARSPPTPRFTVPEPTPPAPPWPPPPPSIARAPRRYLRQPQPQRDPQPHREQRRRRQRRARGRAAAELRQRQAATGSGGAHGRADTRAGHPHRGYAPGACTGTRHTHRGLGHLHRGLHPLGAGTRTVGQRRGDLCRDKEHAPGSGTRTRETRGGLGTRTRGNRPPAPAPGSRPGATLRGHTEVLCLGDQHWGQARTPGTLGTRRGPGICTGDLHWDWAPTSGQGTHSRDIHGRLGARAWNT